MSTYAEKLKDPRWQKKRLKILERDNWKCRECGATDKTLHVHHTQYKGDPWEIEDVKLKTLCCDCHENEHDDNKKKSKYNEFQLCKDAIEITGDELINIPHEDLGVKTLDNPHAIWAYVQYSYNHYATYKNTSVEKFNSQFKNANFTLKEYIKLCHDHLQRDCVRHNILLKTDYGLFGSKSLVYYQNVFFPLSVVNVLKKMDDLENMTEGEYRSFYNKSKFNRLECIDDLYRGINKSILVLEIQFTYNNRTYGI